MGMCLPCLGGAADDVVVTPDPETRRQQLAEAAEKRQKETAYRGVKNPEAVERKRKKQEESEKQAMTASVSGGCGDQCSFNTTDENHLMTDVKVDTVWFKTTTVSNSVTLSSSVPAATTCSRFIEANSEMITSLVPSGFT
uniref:Uncharacterized protein n=1 Tax=Nothobranchius kuhntae TaxID=321403 RepID=A0A1A8KZR8_NOTKU